MSDQGERLTAYHPDHMFNKNSFVKMFFHKAICILSKVRVRNGVGV